MISVAVRACLVIVLLLALSVDRASCLRGATVPDQEGLAFFEKRIRPVLVKHCYECHASDAEEIRGGLVLDTRQGIRRGGDSGPAVTPHEPDDSMLLSAIRHESFEMPPDRKLPDSVIDDFQQWIQRGAVDPREGTSADVKPPEMDIEQGREFWSFRPLVAATAPDVQRANWPETQVDRFILARLEASGLQPMPEADRRTLARRAYYALIGLPPTAEQLAQFVANPEPTRVALAQLVDRLLQSPHFGERWGRHWLDVARFAESSGGGRTLLFPNAWRYRDYVIEAFNDDMPFDQFVREQVAGDLLPAKGWEERRRKLIATAFLLLGPTNYELQDKEALEADVVDEQLDTLGKALLGMTIGCARCHDHKFDPIPTRDYYAMAGILHSTQALIHGNVSSWHKTPLPVPPAQQSQLEAHQQRLKKLKDQLAEREKLNASAKEIKRLKQQIKQHRKTSPPRPVAMAVRDAESIGDVPLAIRGLVHNPGPVVGRGALRVLPAADLSIPQNSSGRLALANWLTSPENPLTARVIVNRVWYWLFGQGIVRTTDNFGTMGARPTHPELLDHLAIQFMNDGWSIKRLVRRLMLSRTYRLSSRTSAERAGVDPSNELLWRMNRKRMDAESLRDTLLMLGGSLNRKMGGPNIAEGTKTEYGYQFDSQRRSVYVPVFRNTLPNLFAVFDFADPNLQVGRRTQSTIAPQALLLMNDPLVLDQARSAARRLLDELDDANVSQRIELAYRRFLSRLPSDEEQRLAQQFLAADRDGSVNRDAEVRRWTMFLQTLILSVDFRYIR